MLRGSISFIFSRSFRQAAFCAPKKEQARAFRSFFCTVAGMDVFKAPNDVIPDVIDQPPASILKVKFGAIDVTPGKTITPTQAKNQPTLEWDADSGAKYTLIMTDPDAPSRQNPKFREWHHWMVVNIPGNDVSKGEHRSEYVGSGPPKGTGLHRYVLVVYKQPDGVNFSSLPKLNNRSGEGRGKRPVREILKSCGMSGSPLVAANFYLAEYDDHVPHLFGK